MLEGTEENVKKVIELCGNRIKVAGDILLQAGFFFIEDWKVLDRCCENVDERRLRDDKQREWLCKWRDAHTFVSLSWNAQALEAETKAFCEEETIPYKKLISLIRFAISGNKVGPPLWESVELLGPHSVSSRVDQYICGFTFAEPGVKEFFQKLRDDPIFRESITRPNK